MPVEVNSEESVVIFRGTPCRRRPEANLQKQLGEDFDTKRMALSLSASRDSELSKKKRLRLLQSAVRKSAKRPKHHRRRRKSTELGSMRKRGQKAALFPPRPQNHVLYHHGGIHSYDIFNNDKRIHKKSSSEDVVNQPSLPWQCTMEQHWRRMPEGTFPLYIQTGRCAQTTCMLDSYSCSPVKYVLKVLKRNPDFCDPIPMLGNETIYEEKWEFSRIKVTVFCECSRLRPGFSPSSLGTK